MEQLLLSQKKTRKKRIKNWLDINFGIRLSENLEDEKLCDILLQILREDMNMDEEIKEDIKVFLFQSKKDYNDVSVIRQNNIVSKYDRQRAKDYIDKYWKDYNTLYPSFKDGGGDCTNFVSQVLFAGGMEWVYDGKLDHYTWYSNWYCFTGATNEDGDRRVSLSWKVASTFMLHWSIRASYHYKLTFENALIEFDDIVQKMNIADIVQFCDDKGIAWHSLAITKKNNNDLILASHTRDSNSRSLKSSLTKLPSTNIVRFYII